MTRNLIDRDIRKIIKNVAKEVFNIEYLYYLSYNY